MKRVTSYSIVCLMAILLAYRSSADDYNQEVYRIPSQISNTITVDLNGWGNYKTVQSAIDAIPTQNQKWICIFIKEGIYNEKVIIPKGKGYIYLQGRGIDKTIIANNDHQLTDTSPTFTAYPDNIIISGITFKNTYNIGLMSTSLTARIKPAVAARILGDKYVVIDSSFDGVQDTLYDCLGRHYYKRCVISGGIDFIFGYAQSLFQGRQSPTDNGGFVFKDCTVTGNGKALLGRAWEPYARLVIFYGAKFSDAILPIGWEAWRAKGQEGHTTFVEFGCTGPRADMSERVPWLKKVNTINLRSLASVSSINQEAAAQQFTYTIDVDPTGSGSFTTVQSAIDSIPNFNQKWIRIFIKAGIYWEKVTIPREKRFIYLQGEGIEQTVIEYDDHQATDTSATFSAFADDITISGITFKNTYNMPNNKPAIVPAVAAMLLGDRYIVTDSSFDGLQDTLFDGRGRHYYKRCVISGGIDFIFGYAQSLFEGCTLNLTLGIYAPERPYGSITANQRSPPLHDGGFVFSNCTITGIGKTLLGRAWGSQAFVIFSQSHFSDVVLPIGWDAWEAEGQEGTVTFVESGCTGPGANTSQRVPWLTKASVNDVARFTSIAFVDQNNWITGSPLGLKP